MITVKTEVDLYTSQQNTASVLAVQGETQTRIISARLMNSGGQPIDLTGATVRIYIPKPDRTIVYLTGSSENPDTGIVDFLLDSQAVATAGTCNCTILISDVSGATLKFVGPILIVAASDTDGAVESSSEFTALQEALAIVHDIDNKVEKTTEINGYALAGDITLGAADVGAVASTEKGAANGVATLNASGKLVQMPTAADIGTNTTVEISAMINAVVSNYWKTIYPVGSIYLSVNSANPGTIWGGTWEAWGTGRVPVGVGSNGTTNYSTKEAIGGSETTGDNIRQVGVNAILSVGSSTSDWYAGTVLRSRAGAQNLGEPSIPYPLDVRQPFITCYMWKRTA